MTHRQSFYQICMTSLTIQVPPQDPELYLLSIYPITTFLFSLNILPEESFLQNPSPLLTFLKQKDSVSEAIVFFFPFRRILLGLFVLNTLFSSPLLHPSFSPHSIQSTRQTFWSTSRRVPNRGGDPCSDPARVNFFSRLFLVDFHSSTWRSAFIYQYSGDSLPVLPAVGSSYALLDCSMPVASEELTKTISPYLFDLLLDPFVHTQLSFKQIFTYLGNNSCSDDIF